jgi:hypothetical protein
MADEKKAAAPATMLARVLRETEIEGETFKPNDVVEFDTHTAQRLVAEGAVDTDPAAVAYAQSLAQ